VRYKYTRYGMLWQLHMTELEMLGPMLLIAKMSPLFTGFIFKKSLILRVSNVTADSENLV
jgi:hypothetical protein